MDSQKWRQYNARKRTINIGCWNVQGLATKLPNLTSEIKRFKMDIIILSETKKKGKGNEELDDFIHLWSGVEKHKRAKSGVSVLVKKNFKKNITGWDLIDDRIIKLDITLFAREIVVVGIYGPTNDQNGTVKDRFWERLEEELEKIPGRKEIFMLGDMNARVGRNKGSRVVGNCGETERNDNGNRFIQICEQMDLRIENTFFDHKKIHKFTWHNESRKLESVIDYVVTRQRSTVKVQDVRVYRGAECGSDHHLLKAICTFPWVGLKKRDRKSNESHNTLKEEHFKVELLQEDSIKVLFQQRTKEALREFEGNSTIEIYDFLMSSLRKIASEVLGKKTRNGRAKVWLTEDIMRKAEKKKETYLKWLSTKKDEDRERYLKEKRELHKVVRMEKNKSWERTCARINSKLGFGQANEAWSILKGMRKDEKQDAKLNMVQMADWTAHYSGLLRESRVEFIEDEPEPFTSTALKITLEELQIEQKKLRNGKASGPGGVCAELIKYGGNEVTRLLTDLINRILEDGIIPPEMKLGYITPIFKKGDRKTCDNYRGICVTNPIMKLLGRIIKNRLEEEFQQAEEQCGFTMGKSCIDHIFTLRQLLEKQAAKARRLDMIFIDLEKAYDSVPRKLLWTALGMAGINKNTTAIIKEIYKNNKCQIKIGSSLSQVFQNSKGLLQGCCMSPTLFKIYIDICLKSWNKSCGLMGIPINDKHLYHLLFADDQVIIAQDEEDASYLLRKVAEQYKQWGLKINYSKTKYMSTDCGEISDPTTARLDRVENFCYLGSILETNGTTETEVAKRVTNGKKAVGLLNSLLWSKNILGKTKKLIYSTLVQSVMLYGSETWTLNKAQEKKILSVEMDFWRRSAGVSRTEHIRNEEIRRRMEVKRNVLEVIEERRLRWYGHLKRMSPGRIPKLAMEWEPEGRRKRGRPRTQWRDKLEESMAGRGLTEDDAVDREEWRRRLEEEFG